MKLYFAKSNWEVLHEPLHIFLAKTQASGFDGTEVYAPHYTETAQEIATLHKEFGLFMVGSVKTKQATPAEQLHSLEEQYLLSLECGATLVNCHTGRDIFSYEDNLRIFERAIELTQQHGVPLLIETHRTRPTYSAIETGRYLEALPKMRLTADFSHWMVVHESDLSDMGTQLNLAIEILAPLEMVLQSNQPLQTDRRGASAAERQSR